MTQTSCPSCGNGKLARFDYVEGAIFICGLCHLQFGITSAGLDARAVTVRDKGLLRATGDRYMDPASIGDPRQYPPYVEFFAHLEKIYGASRALRILDVGCGNGLFIKHCLDLGHDAYGVEINTQLKEIVPTSVADRILWGSAEDIQQLHEDEFQVITFWDSFEHMDDGFAVADTLKSKLSPGGSVYLRVNNSYDIFNLVSISVAKILPSIGKNILKNCFGFPTHLWNFSVRGMHNLADKNGWVISHFTVGDTPAVRLATNKFMLQAINAGYMANRLMRGGKIANYYLHLKTV